MIDLTRQTATFPGGRIRYQNPRVHALLCQAAISCHDHRIFDILEAPGVLAQRNRYKGMFSTGIILLMAEILHQLRLVVYPIICRVLYIPGGAGFRPSTVWT